MSNEVKARPLTDTGNAERLVDRYGKDIRHCSSKGWIVYDEASGCWSQDGKSRIANYAKLTIRAIADEANDIQRKAASENVEQSERLLKQATAIRKHALISESEKARNAMTRLAQSEPRVAIETEQLDADKWLLNVVNGTIDLRSGELRNHRRTDFITKFAPVVYDPDTKCVLWDKFLERVQPDPDVRSFLQRLMGYSLTGESTEHILPINYGIGRNGKSVFTDTVLAIMGSYAKQIPVETLLARKGDRHPTELANLHGCRLAVASEPPQNCELNAALVKQLTGGDRIAARYMYKDYFEFEPTHTLWLSTNHRPVIKENTEAIRRRLLLIDWSVVITEEAQDRELKTKLLREESGIMRWLVQGCIEWQKQGLNPPESIRNFSREYLDEQNNVRTFVDDRCEKDGNARISTKELHNAYVSWSRANDEQSLSSHQFQDSIEGCGFPKGKSNGLMVFRGIKLKLQAVPRFSPLAAQAA